MYFNWKCPDINYYAIGVTLQTLNTGKLAEILTETVYL